jgi:D-beta-D-heptose 7-phosphate kinase/D-beta-D-heptose 1-phosphate adenosyltransferase
VLSCEPQPDKRAVGAGDSFVAAASLALAMQVPARDALRIAAAAAAIVIRSDGTTVCAWSSLVEYFHGSGKKCRHTDELLRRVQDARAAGKRIVFTNGCFDIVHRGHVEFLNQARLFGDVLVVAVNDDDGIRRIKGPDRPVNRLDDRLEVLAGLEAVDYVVPFAGDTPSELIRVLRPDVFVKGGTYRVDSLPEAEQVRILGGTVEIVPLQSRVSTSALIQRIRTDALSATGERRALQ